MQFAVEIRIRCFVLESDKLPEIYISIRFVITNKAVTFQITFLNTSFADVWQSEITDDWVFIFIAGCLLLSFD